MFGIIKQVQGWVKIKGDTDGTKVGNTGDRLHTKYDPIDQTELICILAEIRQELKKANLHLATLSEYELAEGDEDDN